VVSCFSDIWRLLRIYTIPVIRFELRKEWNFSLWQVKMGEGFTCFQPVFEKDASHRSTGSRRGPPARYKVVITPSKPYLSMVVNGYN